MPPIAIGKTDRIISNLFGALTLFYSEYLACLFSLLQYHNCLEVQSKFCSRTEI